MEKTGKIKPVVQKGKASNQPEHLVLASAQPGLKATATIAAAKLGKKKIDELDEQQIAAEHIPEEAAAGGPTGGGEPILLAANHSSAGAPDMAGASATAESGADAHHSGAGLWWLGGIALAGAGVGLAMGSGGGGSSSTAPDTGSVVALGGRVTDGPVSGAAIYRDVNTNGVYDDGDTPITHNGSQIVTDANGDFEITNADLTANGIASLATLKLVAHGGTDTVTGEAVTVDFTAPAGYLYLNPITSLIAAYMEANEETDPDIAAAAVIEALGLPELDYAGTDLYSPGGGVSEEDALAAQQAAATVALAALVFEQAGATEGNAFAYLVDQLAENSDSETPLEDAIANSNDISDEAKEQFADAVESIESAQDIDDIDDALNETYFVDLSIDDDGTPTAGETVTAVLGLGATTDMDVDYTWQVSDDGTTGWTDIDNDDADDGNDNYTLTGAEVEKYVRVVATYTDVNSGEETSPASDPLLVAENTISLDDYFTITAASNDESVSYDTYSSVTFTDDLTGGITVTATSDDASAALSVSNATGIISSLATEASADASEADVNIISLPSPDTLEIGDVSLSASGVASDTDVDLDGVSFDDSAITITASAASADADLDADDATGTIASLTIEASGESADADVYLRASSADASVLTLEDITITASGAESSADANLEGISFDASVITITASGNDSVASMEVSSGIGTISSLSVTASSEDADVDVSISSSSASGDVLNVGDVSLIVSGDDADSDVDLDGVNFDDSAIIVTASGSSADADLDIYDATGTIDTITVLAGPDAHEASAAFSESSDIAVGDVSVTASGDYSDAGVFFSDDSTIAFNASEINVIASGNSADAEMEADNASGTISSLSVTASSEDADADVSISPSSASDDVLNVGDVSLIVSGDDADSDVDLDGVNFDDSAIIVTASAASADADLDADDATGTIASLTIEASGESADADVYLRASSADASVLTLEDITITASGTESSADANLEGISFDASVITITASGNDSVASMEVTSGIGTIDTITVLAGPDADEASAAFSESSDITVGDVSATASGDYSDAGVFFSDDSTIAFNASEISVIASGNSADAEMEADNASGTIASLTVEASGMQSGASASLSSTGPLAIGAIRIEASGSSVSSNDTDTASVATHGDVSLGDFITILASGGTAKAMLSTDSQDAVVFTDNIAGGISVTASSEDSGALMEVDNATGTISSLSVTASSEDADAEFSLSAFSISGDVLSLGDVSLSASATESDTEVNLTRVSFDDSTITITASGSSADADLDADDATGTIASLTIEASGDSADADAYFSGDVTLGDITITASGAESSADANLEGISFDASVVTITASGSDSVASMEVSSATGTIDTITVQTGTGADAAWAVFSESSDITVGDITVTAGAAESSVDVFFSGDSSVTFLDSIITVTASGASAEATLEASDASGIILSLTLEVTGSSAEVDVDLYGDLTVGNITVETSGSSSDAEIQFRGNSNYSVDVTDSDIAFNTSVISVTSAGGSADLAVMDGIGTIAGITISTNGGSSYDYSASAYASVDFSGTLAGDISISATSEEDFAGLDMSSGTRTWAEFSSNSVNTFDSISFTTGDVIALTVGSVTLQYTVQAGDTTIAQVVTGLKADADYAAAPFELYDASGDSNSAYQQFKILWKDEGYNPPSGSGLLSLTLNGVESSLDSNIALPGRNGSLITLGTDIDVTVAVTAESSEVYTNLDNLSGTLDTLAVQATGDNEAYAAIRFDNGAISHTIIETGSVAAGESASGHATAAISQTVAGGDVTVSGDGWATLLLNNQQVDTVDLTDLHTGASDRWGAFTLQLLLPDAGLDAAAVTTVLESGSVMTITGFQTSSDSIIASIAHDDRADQWANNWQTDVEPYYAEDEGAGGSYADLASAALAALNTGGANEPGYYFGVYDGDGYLFYDWADAGMTSVVKLEGVTSFDAINVAAPGSYSYNSTGTNTWGVASVIGDYDCIAYNTDIIRTDTFVNARIASLEVGSGEYDGSYTSANLTFNANTVGSLAFLQAAIEVHGDGLGGDASLTVNDAQGTIDSLHVSANASGIVVADFNGFSGAVREVSLSADDLADATVSIGGLQENVQQLWMSAYRGDTTADITLADGYVVKTDVYLQADTDPATATLTVTQTDHGGEVFAASFFEEATPLTETAVFDLTYTEATADQILLCYEYDPDTGTTSASGDFEGTFHLTLDKLDVDTAFDTDDMLTIIGWDSGSALDTTDILKDDTISCDGDIGNYVEDLVAETTLDDFLAAADSTLNGAVDYYFGVVGTNGYLAYDADGTGITQMIEFQNLIDFDATRIINAAVGPM